ncbi:MAG: integral rane sensor signal transduction histidine kinase, partial [Ilumatobacteraceae bacterium]|nr:integral rane sensor signal transduction histidine kinase [Ilumatobacteraceae bacterium]
MSLRVRLVAALGLLLAVGLALFGFGTYSVYARLQHQRLDDNLQQAVQVASRQLLSPDRTPNPAPIAPPTSSNSGTSGQFPNVDGPGRFGPPDVYAVLLDANGNVLQVRDTFTTAKPDLPSTLPQDQRYVTLGSSDGSGEWRAFVQPQQNGSVLLVAVPSTETDNSLQRLILIELIAGLVLLGLLTTGSWLVLRRGLRPLESMAETAVSISGGDLSQRVTPADNRTEVGQLGWALNTMLGGLEQSFAEQQATEDRLRQFLADASHELRTPLTSIRGFAELFRLGGESAVVERGTMVRRIEEESARMNVLVDDLLLLARVDQTRPAERGPVDLAVLAA